MPSITLVSQFYMVCNSSTLARSGIDIIILYMNVYRRLRLYDARKVIRVMAKSSIPVDR
jgi:hypothetical protein